MDRLTEHQSQLMVDQFDALRADLFPNAELPGPCLVQASRETTLRFGQRFFPAAPKSPPKGT